MRITRLLIEAANLHAGVLHPKLLNDVYHISTSCYEEEFLIRDY